MFTSNRRSIEDHLQRAVHGAQAAAAAAAALAAGPSEDPAAPRDARVWLVGHSLGGAVALMTAAYLSVAKGGPHAQLYAPYRSVLLGQPKRKPCHPGTAWGRSVYGTVYGTAYGTVSPAWTPQLLGPVHGAGCMVVRQTVQGPAGCAMAVQHPKAFCPAHHISLPGLLVPGLWHSQGWILPVCTCTVAPGWETRRGPKPTLCELHEGALGDGGEGRHETTSISSFASATSSTIRLARARGARVRPCARTAGLYCYVW